MNFFVLITQMEHTMVSSSPLCCRFHFRSNSN